MLKKQLEESCTHTDEERALQGTWVTAELHQAIQKGYRVIKIDEVWHFPEKSDTLFSDYVNTFLKIQQEASGFPPNVVTEEEKKIFVENFFEKERVELELEKICLNHARRSVSKLFLNSLWGRFAIRSNFTYSELIRDPEQFARFIFGNGRIVKHFSFVSDSVALIQWCYPDDVPCQTKDVNVFIGCFVTAYGRLELYKQLDKLGERVLYTDTDSIIYVSKPNEWQPETGVFLGDLSDEVGPDDSICEFSAFGPKTYGYRTVKGKVCLKAKGITLNAENVKQITLKNLMCLVEKYTTAGEVSQLVAITNTIVRDKKKFTLHNRSLKKRFQVVYNKRVLLPNYTTLPYGY